MTNYNNFTNIVMLLIVVSLIKINFKYNNLLKTFLHLMNYNFVTIWIRKNAYIMIYTMYTIYTIAIIPQTDGQTE